MSKLERDTKFFIVFIVMLGAVMLSLLSWGIYRNATRKCVRAVSGSCLVQTPNAVATYPCDVCLEYDR